MSIKRFALVVCLLALLVAPTVMAQGKSITVGWPQEPDSLNPMYYTMTYAGYTTGLYLAYPWDFDNNLSPVPVLVTEIPSHDNGGISEDNTTFTLKLKEGLTWSDGDPLDSADFLFTYEMYMSPSNTPQSQGTYKLMESIEAPDALTVVVKFPEPYAPWLGMWSRILPEHVLRPVYDADGTLDNADFNRNPSVSSGPYIFKEWNVGNNMRFDVNPSYVLGQPKIDTIFVRFFSDDDTYTASLIAGEIQVATFFDYSYVPKIEEAGIPVDVIASGYNEGWFINAGPSAHVGLQDVNVRKAVAMAFDRFSVTNDVLLGATYPSSSFWEGTPYANPDLEPVPYDPEGASALLDEAGWVDSNGDGTRDKDGVELVLRFYTNQRTIRVETIQPLVKQQLEEIGIGVELGAYPTDQFFNGYLDNGPIATGQYDIAEWSSSPDSFPDPDTFNWLCSEIPSPDSPSGANWNYYCDEELNALFEEQAKTTDFEARVDLFHQIDQKLYDAYIWVGVWFDADTWSVGKPLVNAQINGVTPFWDVQNWDVEG